MWIWDGKICPEPGEVIDDACRQSIAIAQAHGGGSKLDPVAQQYDICFRFTFNDTTVRAFADSTVEELCEQYHYARTVPA